MKLSVLFFVIFFMGSVTSVFAQNKDVDFDAFKRFRTEEINDFQQNKEAEYKRFKEQYYAAFEKFKQAYIQYLNGELEVVDLMASDDNIKITPLPSNVQMPKIIRTAAQEKDRIQRDIVAASMMNADDLIEQLSDAEDTLVRVQEAAAIMEAIAENIQPEQRAESNIGYSEPVKEVTDVVLESLDEGYFAALEREAAAEEAAVVNASSVATSVSVTEVNNEISSLPSNSNVSTPCGKPTDYTRISSPFGTRVHPITRKKHTHKGVDMAAPRMTPIYATADGEVTYANYNGGYGNFVKINHRNGYKTAYAHLHKISVNKGQSVKRGDLIGYVGTTGRSTGNHLHYEIYYQDGLIDPATTL